MLFIDEAYQLNPSRGAGYQGEVVDELVKCLTHPDYKNKLVVILAGYKDDMDDMLRANPGLQSRFSERLHFEDWSEDHIVDVFLEKMKKDSIPFEGDEHERLHDLAKRLKESENFGNGRDTLSWATKVYQQVANRGGGAEDKYSTTMSDIENGLEELLKGRAGKDKTAKAPPTPSQAALRTATKSATHFKTATATKVAEDVEVEEPMEVEGIEGQAAENAEEEQLRGNPFENIDQRLLSSLQDFMVAKGLDTEEGIQHLLSLAEDSQELSELLKQIVTASGMSLEQARKELVKWKDAQKVVAEYKKKAAILHKTKKREAIWRCRVCGRADLPYIACYVSPYIVGFRSVEG